jgi:tetratricopeptide (TPR) repeat protein
MTVVALCCAAGVAASEAPPDGRLQEARTASDEANTLWEAGRYADAIAKGEQALAPREAVLEDTHPDVAKSLEWLGTHHLLQGNPVRAEPLLQRALAIQEATLDKHHPDIARTLTYLANLYKVQGLYERVEPLDSAAVRLRDALANRDAAFQPHAQALYQLAFRPLLPLLGTARRQQFLVDTFDFTYLPSGKHLLPRPQKSTPPDSVAVLADPDFSTSLQALPRSNENTRTLAMPSLSGEDFFSMLRADLAQRAWALTPLPGTRKEAEAIQRLLPQAQLFLGPEATKTRLLQLPPPGVLHLATHGFFVENAPTRPASRALGQFGALGERPTAELPPDPLLRSGLALAGARAPASSGFNPGSLPLDSGLVVALELAGLNLWGTQLVVLSACDTGRGDVKLGQGVYGLHRAFLVAGAEAV